jgi:serine/threonine-protein phosphatase 2A regulatory subunit B
MDPDASGGWRFAQCFGDKGDVEDITEGNHISLASTPDIACFPLFIILPLHRPNSPCQPSSPSTYQADPLTFFESCTADIISAVEFDSTGNYLATGDKGGRVVLFERNDMVRSFCPLCKCGPLY